MSKYGGYMTRAKPVLFAILLLALSPCLVLAQPTISGSLSGTLGPGSYIVTGHCTVDAGNTLTIEPGTTFLFAGHFYLKVYGTLNAVGTEQDSLVFVSQFSGWEYEWSGIRFMNGSSGSVLSYAYLENAKYHMYPDYNGGAIYTEANDVTVSHCWIKNNYASSGGGMYISSATVTVSDCIFFGNEAGNGGGMYINNSNGVQVNNCVFAKNASTST
jgi:hypothetical protein